MTIVTTHYSYKRPPRKRKVVALDVPAIVKPTPMKKKRQQGPVIRFVSMPWEGHLVRG